MAAIAGLAVGSRLLTTLATLVQGGVVVALLVLWQDPHYQIGADDTEFIIVLVSVLMVDLLAIGAALMPPYGVALPRARAVMTIATGSWRNAALIAMGLVAAASLALLFSATSNPGRGEYTYTVTGVVGLAGALVVMVGLGARLRSIVLGAAVVQGLLAAMLYLWFGLFSLAPWSATPFVLLGIGVADILTMRAALLADPSARS